jgi:predicted ATPase/class 3 adenylate cyclase
MVSAAAARKTVTVLFCDLSGSTALGERLDPEPLRELMGSWYESMRNAVEAHGGTVEKFAGDAVMAVFGLPQAHEDDALRAVRAALAMQEAGGELVLRIGINTGVVVTGDELTTLVTGDAVNTAKRLEQAAGGGEVLIGAVTERLVRHAVELEPVTPIEAKGKSTAVDAWRVMSLVEGAEPFARRWDTPLVGRRRELSVLRDALTASADDRSCRLVTVVGTAGVGKTRLASELSAEVGEHATVLSGRCLPYGDGITFWPLVELLRAFGGDEAVAAAVQDEPDASLIVERLEGLTSGTGSTEELFWAVRRLFEALARQKPLLVVLEDVHWAEEVLLDLVEHVTRWSRNAAVLLLCIARPELLEERPRWEGEIVRLEPLSRAEASELLDALDTSRALSEELRERVAETAQGNPLYAEQVVAMLAEADDATETAALPPTIQALLAARLDHLDPVERDVLERAAVVGDEFWPGAVAALGEGEDVLGATLLGLVRRELVEPAPSMVPGEDGFSFRHALIRDAAYASAPLRRRAGHHERFAEWLESDGFGEEFDEIRGYHLEQAVRYRGELGPPSKRDRAHATRASELLESAGARALSRGDMPAAVDLLSRAAALRPESDPRRLTLLAQLGAALREAGELTRADEVLSEAIAAGRSAGNRRAELAALIERAALRLMSEPEDDADLREVEASIPALEEFGDDRALATAWSMIGRRYGLWKGQFARGEAALERALTYARRTGDRRQEALILGQIAFSAWAGPTPVIEAAARCRRLVTEAGGDQLVKADVSRFLAVLEAMRGDFGEARTLVGEARATYEELGMNLMAQAAISLAYGDIGLLAADYRAAATELRTGFDALEGMGERGYQSSVAAYLSQALYEEGRLDEADDLARRAEAGASPDDLWSQVMWRGTRAKLCASRGAHDEAELYAREALGLAAATDALDMYGNALVVLADTLALAGRDEEAVTYLADALHLYERKGNDVSAERARARLAGASA